MQIQRHALGDQQVFIRLRQKQHIADHFRHPVVLFQAGVEHIFQLLHRTRLAQRDLGLGDQVGDRCAHLMGDIGGEIGLAAEHVLDPADHLVKRDHQLFQLDRYAVRIQPHVEIFRRNIFDRHADVAQRLVAFTHGDQHDHNNQQADDGRDHHQIALELIEIVKVKVDRQRGQQRVGLVVRADRGRNHPISGGMAGVTAVLCHLTHTAAGPAEHLFALKLVGEMCAGEDRRQIRPSRGAVKLWVIARAHQHGGITVARQHAADIGHFFRVGGFRRGQQRVERGVDLLQVADVLLGEMFFHRVQHNAGKGGKSDDRRQADKKGQAGRQRERAAQASLHREPQARSRRRARYESA